MIFRTVLSPTHTRRRWVYFSEMVVGESILLKTFDSSKDPAIAKFALHSSIELPDQETHAARQSLEVRSLVFFGPLEEGFGRGFIPPAGQAGLPGGPRVVDQQFPPPNNDEWSESGML